MNPALASMAYRRLILSLTPSMVMAPAPLARKPMTIQVRLLRAAVYSVLFSLPLLGTVSARAEPVKIVALGASNTYGKGVSRSEAFPAQLEIMLKARGYDVRVINAGVNGDTPDGMLRRIGSDVPSDTRIVILNPGGNDLRACHRRRGGGECATREEHAASINRVVGALRARGAKVIMANFSKVADHDRQADGRHLTPEKHRRVAAQLLPQVASAIGKR